MKKLMQRSAVALAVATLGAGVLATTAEAAPAAPAAVSGGDPTLTDVYIWATNVNLREQPTSESNRLAVRSKYWLDAVCQTQGQTVTDPAVGTNNWWTAVQEFAGSDIAWVNNLYLRGGVKIEGVPDC
ncbi:peptidase M23 [Streptomyces sp. NBC_01352]|uniref:peptidase M23 n=1 Tax=unclassified Streptomyces TaxID=2593676 RepID=UPI002259783E|nr:MULTISPECIES: peptidase M23 [unclassified Streptomyces]MCX4703582.1 peptidase M23 [Streptomyces sp. NBC_01373]